MLPSFYRKDFGLYLQIGAGLKDHPVDMQNPAVYHYYSACVIAHDHQNNGQQFHYQILAALTYSAFLSRKHIPQPGHFPD